jgi:hypothetical protein
MKAPRTARSVAGGIVKTLYDYLDSMALADAKAVLKAWLYDNPKRIYKLP